MKILTKEQLINELKKIKNSGWIKNARHGNAGGVGKPQNPKTPKPLYA